MQHQDAPGGYHRASPNGSAGEEFAFRAGETEDSGLIPGLGRSPGEGNGNSLQYSCLGNPTDRGAWWATVQWVTESDTTERLSTQEVLILSKRKTNIYHLYVESNKMI